MYINGYYNKLKDIGFWRWLDHIYYKVLVWWSDLTDPSAEYLAPVYADVRDLPPPEIVPRADWGARPPKPPYEGEDETLESPAANIVFHDTKGAQCFTKEECCERVRQVQDLHMDKWKFSDIAYNFLVGGDGRIYEGRGWFKEGEHTDGWNHKSIGIAAIGDFKEDAPNDELLEGIERFVNLGISNDNQYLTDTYTVLGHCQLDKNDYFTECPGDGFYEEVRNMPHWVMGEKFYETTSDSDMYDSEDSTVYGGSLASAEEEGDWPKGYDEELFGPWEYGPVD